jgi:hypothetical protein
LVVSSLFVDHPFFTVALHERNRCDADHGTSGRVTVTLPIRERRHGRAGFAHQGSNRSAQLDHFFEYATPLHRFRALVRRDGAQLRANGTAERRGKADFASRHKPGARPFGA